MTQLEVMPQEDAAQTSLTLADMARHLTLAESTTRYYCKRFAHFIPVIGEGRRRRYGPDALEVMRAITEYMGSLRSASAVEEALERRFPRVLTAPEPCTVSTTLPVAGDEGASAPAYVAQQTRALQVMALTMHKLASQQDALKQIVAVSKLLAEENKTLKQEVATLKELLRTSERVQQEDLQQIRDWVGRALRKSGAPAEEQP